MSNNPIRFSDPTGHKEANEVDGGTPCYPGELACQLEKSGYKQKTKEQIAKDVRAERPISGVHLGASYQKGVIKDTGTYFQLDFLMDWKMGNFYTMGTLGQFGSFGSPTGAGAEVYGGTTTVHGIPLYGDEDISDSLEGTNFDGAVTIGADGLGKISGTKGVSVDVDDNLHPVYTGAGLLGYQYATENSIEWGGNLIPNGLEVGFEGGVSYSKILYIHSFEWWPFR